jgi:predicted RNA methylase
MLVDFNKWAGTKPKKEVVKGDSTTTTSSSMPIHVKFNQDGMRKHILSVMSRYEKMNRPFPEDNWTMRRDRQALSMHVEALQMARRGIVLQNILNQAQSGVLPDDVAPILVKLKEPVVRMILYMEKWPGGADAYAEIRKSFSASGMTSENYGRVREAVLLLDTGAQDVENAKKVWEQQTRLKEMIGNGLDFFPTPENVANAMVEVVRGKGLGHPFTFCEPSAGSGNLLVALLKQLTPERITLIEYSYDLVEYLKVRKFNTEVPIEISFSDFKDYPTDKAFDLILMNPPFKEEIEHVKHAYECLNPVEGLMVSVMSAGVKFNNNKKTTDFRNWLNGVGGDMVSLPANSFASSKTGVSSVLVSVRKNIF